MKSVGAMIEEARGERPPGDYVWCDECARWEYSGHGANNRRSYLRERGWAALLVRIGSVFSSIGTWFYMRAQLAFVRDNRRRGLLVEEKPQ